VQPTAVTTDGLTDDLFGFVAYLMKTTQHGVFQVAAELDLSMSQLRALFVLSLCDHDLTLGELAAEVGLSVAATGRLVDALVRDGLASRREDPLDRRVKRLALTAHGREAIDRLADSRREGLRQFVETLDDAAREQLSRALAATPTLTDCRARGTDQENTP
jgi:DNA-binding MarR family transcriptional regulator